jgi:hypothetical protein
LVLRLRGGNWRIYVFCSSSSMKLWAL